MKIWNGIDSFPDYSAVVASVGNYDGVHLGHRAILHQVVEHARGEGRPALLISFKPHPLAIIAPERCPRLLQTRGQQIASLEESGLTDLLLIDFTPEIAELGGRTFFEQVLRGRVRFAAIHVGENFRFGNQRSGNQELLEQIGRDMNFDVSCVLVVWVGDEVVSSTAIRAAVRNGEMERVRGLLGRPFELTGEVVRGEDRGSKLQFPTANLELENEILPSTGVYVTETVALASRYPSITNIGVRPTFGEERLTVETHLLEFEGDLYLERIGVRFLARLRDEMRFDSAADLSDQIARDRAAAESYFQNLQPWKS